MDKVRRIATTSAALLIALTLLMTVSAAILSGCVAGDSPLGADIAAGAVSEQAGFEFLHWKEGLAIMIWHDFLGDSGSHSESEGPGFMTDPVYKLRGYAQSRDGQRFEWEVQTRNGKTAQFWLDDVPYDLSRGALFIVTVKDGETEIRQLDRDLSGVQPNYDSCVAFARSDPDLARFIGEVFSSSTPSPTASADVTPAPPTTSLSSATALPTPTPSSEPQLSPLMLKTEAQRIHFMAGATAATQSHTLAPEAIDYYILRARAGQTLVVDITAPHPVLLNVWGADGTFLKRQSGGTSHWEGSLPATQDYVLELTSTNLKTAYSLTVTIPKLPEPTPTAPPNIYQVSEQDFEIRYPADFALDVTCSVGTIVADPVVSLRLGGDQYYSGTNLLNACVIVGVDRSEFGRSTCTELKDAHEEYWGQEEINGTLFSVVARGGVAAGHIHDVTIYRTPHAETCYEVALLLHYSNPGVYEPGTVSEFDRDAVMERLKQVLYSITMTSAEKAKPDVSITGTVMSALLSARVIMLETPVDGFSVIALTEKSEVFSADGNEMVLRDILPGTMISASGQPGESNALIASQVRVLDTAHSMTTPIPTPQTFSFTAEQVAADSGDGIVLKWEAVGERAMICPLIGETVVDSCCLSDIPLSGSYIVKPSDIIGAYTGFKLIVEAGGIRAVRYVPLTVECPDTFAAWFFDKPPGMCPRDAALFSYAAAQRFERGLMIWIEALDEYHVLLDHDRHIPDETPGDLSPTGLRVIRGPLQLKPGASVDNRVEAAPPVDRFEPVSGFGLLWRGEVIDAAGRPLTDDLRAALGWALEPEYGFDTVYQCAASCGARWNCYLQGPEGEIFHVYYLPDVGHYWKVVT